ncbi:hypothetical protein MPLSOD_90190 [Mesorhizobium sp. SOD10]|nr:hypothetical protein MPLSOD_90190 [Mesorhizobium sp. SOD10]
MTMIAALEREPGGHADAHGDLGRHRKFVGASADTVRAEILTCHVPTVPVGFSAARIATIELRPIIKFRDYILPILRKTLSPITTFGLPALDLPAQGFSAPHPPACLPAIRQAIHHPIGSNILCDGSRVRSIWRNRTLRAIDLA